MGNQLFSCCLPGENKQSSGSGDKVGYARLQGGKFGAGPNDVGTVTTGLSDKHSDLRDEVGDGNKRSASSAAVDVRSSAEISLANGASSSSSSCSSGNTRYEGEPTTKSPDEEKAPKHNQNSDVVTHENGGSSNNFNRNHTPNAVYGTSNVYSSTSRGPPGSKKATNGLPLSHPQAIRGVVSSATGGMATRPSRIVHAHPNNDQRQGMIAGAGLGGRAQQFAGTGAVGAAGARGGGRLGAVTAIGGGGGVRGFPGPRGMQRAVPAASSGVMAKYEMKEVLGVGSTSTCYRCVNRHTRKQYACKVRRGGVCVCESGTPGLNDRCG